MNVIVPCTEWVPVCWRELLGLLSINTKEDTLPDPLTVHSLDKPAMVDNPLAELSLVDDSLGSPLMLGDPLDTLGIAYKSLGKLHVKLPDLPNSIIEDILSRLSSKFIFQCQRDSKALQVLTKTRYFARMQLNRSSPVIILQSIPKLVFYGPMDISVELYFINEESRHVERRIVEIDSCYKQSRNPILLIGSHDGFLLFTNNMYSLDKEEPSVFYAWNPITNQKVMFRPQHSDFHVCGFYFCSLRREYVLLFVSKSGAPFEFRLYNLGIESWEKVANFSCPPSCDRPAVIVNKTLYWMVDRGSCMVAPGAYPWHSDFIVSFEIETKKFGTIGHDGLSVRDKSRVHLFKLDEELCICAFISLSRLELSVLNQGTKCWVKRHSLNLPIGDVLDHMPSKPWANILTIEVLCYRKGKLLVRRKKRLFFYDLNSNTCRLVEIKEVGNCNVQSVVHIDSLVSF